MRRLRKQQGWVGLVALLFAVVVVALMARTVLKQYGLYPGASAHADRSQGLEVDKESVVPSGAAPSPQDAMERVRRLGETVRRRASDLD